MAGFGTILRVASAAAMLAATGAPAFAAGEDCPPNPEPGKCYEKVLTPGYSVYTGGGYSAARESSFEWREVPCRPGGGGRVSQARVAPTPQLVRAVQAALAGEGYYAGPINGEFNAGAERALARFQADRGLAGGWNPQTLRALGVPE